jgi:hypothetical protein
MISMATPPPRSTSKPAGICTAYTPLKKRIPFNFGHLDMCLNSGRYALKCKNRAKTSDIIFLYEIKIMRLSGEAAIDGYGKVSCGYEKNSSQDTT